MVPLHAYRKNMTTAEHFCEEVIIDQIFFAYVYSFGIVIEHKIVN